MPRRLGCKTRASATIGFCAVAAVCLALATGCNPAAGPGGDAGAENGAALDAKDEHGPPAPTAREALDRMVAAYRKATGYEDSGELVVNDVEDGQRVERAAPFTVAFERPHKLRMHAFDAVAVCDGEHYRAHLRGLPNQVLELPAPKEFAMENVYADPVLTRALTRMTWFSVQLTLLLEKNPLELILKDAQPPKLLEDAVVDGETCQRVEVENKTGSLVFWIDLKQSLLRRLEFASAPPAPGETDPPPAASWSTTFHGARFTDHVDPNAFVYSAPEEVVRVRRFDTAPPLSSLLGKRIPEFKFKKLDGAEVTRESLAGKVAVLEFWGVGYPTCRPHLSTLQELYTKYKKHPRVEFVAVNIDPEVVRNEGAADAFRQGGISIPIARDLDQFARHTFDIENMPTLFVLGPDGRVQENEVEGNPQLLAGLGEIVDKLLAGEDTFENCRQRYDERRQQFLVAASQEESAGAVETELALPEVAPRSEPQKVELTSLWAAADLKEPGNVLVIDDESNESRLFVVDGARTVVEVSAQGAVTARHELPIPETAVVKRLRTAVDKEGRRFFVAFEVLQKQFHVFDGQWKPLFSHPDSDTPGIVDVRLADLDGNGELAIYVGYVGVGGIHRVSMQGKRTWRCRQVEGLLSMAVGGADAEGRHGLMATHLSGNIFTLSGSGDVGQPIAVAERGLRAITAVDLDGDGSPELCGIAFAPRTVDDTALGLAPNGQELWSYDLPDSLPAVPSCEGIVGGKLLAEDDRGHWILAGPDGSLHFVGSDGEPLDAFNLGKGVGGLSLARIGGQPALILAAGDRLEAFRVAKRP